MKKILVSVNDVLLGELIAQWFAENSAQVKSLNFWNRNSVAQTMKNNLQQIGRWPRRKRKEKQKKATKITLNMPNNTKEDEEVIDHNNLL